MRSICSPLSTPPCIDTISTFGAPSFFIATLATFFISLDTCNASSLVGTRTRPNTGDSPSPLSFEALLPFRNNLQCCTIGIPYANVFPLPVGAIQIMLLFRCKGEAAVFASQSFAGSKIGHDLSCTGVGLSGVNSLIDCFDTFLSFLAIFQNTFRARPRSTVIEASLTFSKQSEDKSLILSVSTTARTSLSQSSTRRFFGFSSLLHLLVDSGELRFIFFFLSFQRCPRFLSSFMLSICE
mmetsp:Transcript_8330/g.16955  ORF Transcript_8330/g.16955 Transcript_8330/m.16955 type:complete len:239 (+) Transcript_8330:588-1304(+)